MPNIANVLKNEIARVARKAVRAETEGLKGTVSRQRAEIVALKRRTQELEQQLRRVGKGQAKAASAPPEDDDAEAGRHRFSAKGLASQRRRLGLSAEDFGLLLGVSGQSIYKWERGEAHPRASHLPAIAAARGLGKKAAAARLDELRGQA
jgi:DNA-binding transcriptional regulator YiaG